MSKSSVFQLLLLVALVPASLVLSATPAGAHATIVLSKPAAGEELRSAPGTVVLTFSEPLIRSLSKVVVIDPNGGRHEGRPRGERSMDARIRTNAPGIYRVEWKTVSPVDGHSLEGRFSFGVGVKPDEEAGTNLAPRTRQLVLAVFRATEYAGLLAATGMMLISFLGRREPRLEWVSANLRIPLTLALFSGIVVVGGEALLASSNLSGAPDFFGTYPGLARLLRLGFEAAALAFAPSIAAAGINVVFSLLALSAAGHAAAIRPASVGIGVDAVHLFSAGIWAGGILALAVVSAGSNEDWRELLNRFTPIAIPAFLVTVLTGVLRGTQELSQLSDLWSSGYGAVLLAKSLGVLAMIPLSVLAWRRSIKRPLAEALVAGLVILAAGLLAAFPLPPARVAEAEVATEKSSISGLPKPEDLTLGAYAGEVLLGITLRPGEPGRNEVLIYLLPIEGEEEAREVTVSAEVDGKRLKLETCGSTCRKTISTLSGGERLSLDLSGTKRGNAQVQIPAIAAPDATSILQKMDARMRFLKTFRIDETLRPAKAPTSARYSLQAPDRLHMEVSSGFESIRIGQASYQRESQAAQWKVEQGAPAIKVPFFIWGTPPFASARILGSESVNGMGFTLVGFFEDRGGLPIWFKQWIDPDGLVRKAEMRAQGHFMDHRYFDFDAPFPIERPVKE